MKIFSIIVFLTVLISSCSQSTKVEENEILATPLQDIQHLTNSIPADQAIPQYHQALRNSMMIIESEQTDFKIRHDFVDSLALVHERYIYYLQHINQSDSIYGFSALEFFGHPFFPLRNETKDDTLEYYGVVFNDVDAEGRFFVPVVNPKYIQKYALLGHNSAILDYSELVWDINDFTVAQTSYAIKHNELGNLLHKTESFLEFYPNHGLYKSVQNTDTLVWNFFSSDRNVVAHFFPSPGNYQGNDGLYRLRENYIFYHNFSKVKYRGRVIICYVQSINHFKHSHNADTTDYQFVIDTIEEKARECIAEIGSL